MIANLKIVVKTFAKITKTLFAGLSATIMETRRKPILILHLEAKYTKEGLQKSTMAKSKRSIF